MPYTVFFNDEEKIVQVKVSGAQVGDSEKARKEAICLCAEKQCNRLLVDLREKIPENTTLECYSFGVAVAHNLAGVSIAHVLPADPQSRENVEFTATVAANRGVVTREFHSVDEAKQWLLERPK